MARTISAMVISLSMGLGIPASAFAQIPQIPAIVMSQIVCRTQIPPAKVAQRDPREVCRKPGSVQKPQRPAQQKPQNFPTRVKPQNPPNMDRVCREKFPPEKVDNGQPPEEVCKKLEPRQKPERLPQQKP